MNNTTRKWNSWISHEDGRSLPGPSRAPAVGDESSVQIVANAYEGQHIGRSGNVVDEADSDPAVFEAVPDLPSEPRPEYWAAALREVFEETGVLLAVDGNGEFAADAVTDEGLEINGWNCSRTGSRFTIC